MSEKILKEEEQKVEQGIQELDDEKLDQVSGAGDPFANVPRVPLAEIDDELRDKA